MKKFLKDLIKNWIFIDAIFIVAFIIGFAIFANILKVPFYPAVCGILPLLGLICISKQSISGNVLGIAFLALDAWFLWDFGLMGDLIATIIFQIPLIVLAIVKLAKNIADKKETFNKWDYVTLIACLLLLSYPFYLLMIRINANYAIFQTIIFEVAFLISFLEIKYVKFAKYLSLIVTALQLTVYILFLTDVVIAASTFAFGILLCLIYQIVLYAKDFYKYEKQKKLKELNK